MALRPNYGRKITNLEKLAPKQRILKNNCIFESLWKY